jgi:predicted dehydrogenase
MVSSLINGGGDLVMVYSMESDLLKTFTKTFPGVKVARSEEEILEDDTIRLVASASIPVDRAPLGIKVMQAGKDFMTDKPGIVNFDQFKKVKKIQKETNRIYSIVYSERLGSPAGVKAGELVQAGAIGKVIQTVGLGPHRMQPKTRPDWFFDPAGREGYFAILAHIRATSSCFTRDRNRQKLIFHKLVILIHMNIRDLWILVI